MPSRVSDGSFEVTFKDGSKATTDVIIGADGVHSITRAHILGADHPAVGAKNHDGYQNWRRMIPMEKAIEYGMDPKWKVFVPIMCGPKGNINTMPLAKGKMLSVGIARFGTRWEADQTSGTKDFSLIYLQFQVKMTADPSLSSRKSIGEFCYSLDLGNL